MSPLWRTVCFGAAALVLLVAALAAHDGQRRRLDMLTCIGLALFIVPFAVQAWVDWYGA
jgi:hypothetical protein